MKYLTDFLKSPVGITLFIGIIAAFLLPYFLTQFYLGVNYQDTGPIGDTIGGIAGPILNIAGLIIVYFSFQQQLDANRKQWSAFKKEQKKSRREEQFSIIEKSINLLAEDIQKHEYTFRAVAELIEQFNFWDESPDVGGDFLQQQIIKLQQSTWFDWRDNKQIRSAEDLWSFFDNFNWFANYIESQYNSVMSQIKSSSLKEPQRNLLQSTLRNRCILPTYSWLPEELMQQLYSRDSSRFEGVRIVSIMNQLRVHTPMIFPEVIHPFLEKNRKHSV